MPDYREFSKKVKEKYPQYKDVDDYELAKKMVEKYPQYKSQVIFEDFDLKKKVSPQPQQGSTSGLVPSTGGSQPSQTKQAIKSLTKGSLGFGKEVATPQQSFSGGFVGKSAPTAEQILKPKQVKATVVSAGDKSFYQNELKSLTDQMNLELESAGDNEKFRQQVLKQYEPQIKKLEAQISESETGKQIVKAVTPQVTKKQELVRPENVPQESEELKVMQKYGVTPTDPFGIKRQPEINIIDGKPVVTTQQDQLIPQIGNLKEYFKEINQAKEKDKANEFASIDFDEVARVTPGISKNQLDYLKSKQEEARSTGKYDEKEVSEFIETSSKYQAELYEAGINNETMADFTYRKKKETAEDIFETLPEGTQQFSREMFKLNSEARDLLSSYFPKGVKINPETGMPNLDGLSEQDRSYIEKKMGEYNSRRKKLLDETYFTINDNIIAKKNALSTYEKQLKVFEQKVANIDNPDLKRQYEKQLNEFKLNADKMRDEIDQLQQSKTSFFNPKPSDVGQFTKFSNSAQQIFYALPKDMSAKDKFDFFYRQLYNKTKDMKEKGDFDADYLDGIGQNVRDWLDIDGYSFAKLSDAEKEYLANKKMLQSLTPIYFNNATGITEESAGFINSFWNGMSGMINKNTNLKNRSQTTIASEQLQNIQKLGFSAKDLTAGKEQQKDLEQRVSNIPWYSAETLGEALGTTAAIMTDMAVGGAVLKVAKGPKAIKAIVNAYDKATDGTLYGKYLKEAVEQGVKFEVSGNIIQSAEDELNFVSGFAGTLGGELLGTVFKKAGAEQLTKYISGVFGKSSDRAAEVLKRAGEINARGIAEVGEETTQELVSIYNDELRSRGFWEEVQQRYGTFNDVMKLVATSYIMGSAFGLTSSTNETKSLEESLTPEQQQAVQSVVSEVSSDVADGAEAIVREADNIEQTEKAITETEQFGKTEQLQPTETQPSAEEQITKTQENVNQENITGLPSDQQVGETTIEAKPIEATSTEQVEAGGNVQALEEKVVTKTQQNEVQQTETETEEIVLPGENQKRRDEGRYTKDGVEYVRNEPSPGVRGKEGDVRFTESTKEKYTYKLVEADELQPSHQNGQRNPNHFIPEAQPKSRTDAGSIVAEQSFANNPRFESLGQDQDAYSGAPIVNERNEVIQGNNRSAGLKKGYKQGSVQYKQDLANNAEQFGFTKEQVEGMNNPVLVREIKVDDDRAIELGNYDVKDMETGGKSRIDATTLSRRVPLSARQQLTDVLFQDDNISLNESIRKNQNKVIELLRKYLNQAQRTSLVKDGLLTKNSISDIEELVKQFLFDGADTQLSEVFENLPKTVQEGVRKSMPYIFGVDFNKSILKDLQNGLIALNQFVSSGIKDFAEWKNQQDMFNDGKTPSEMFSPLAVVIAEKLNSSKQSEIVEYFKKYASETKGTEADMFNKAIEGKTKEQATKDIFGESSTEVKQGAVKQAPKKEAPKPKPSEEEKVDKKAIDKAISFLDDLENKLDQFGKETLGINIPVALLKTAVQVAKTSLKAGKAFTEAVNDAIQHIKDSDFYKKLSDVDKKSVENNVSDVFGGKKKFEDIVEKEKKILTQKIKDYAKGIIDGTWLFKRFSQDEQQGIARGGEIHAEATAILGTNEKANGKTSTTNEEQENSIEQYAKEKGIWVDNVNDEYGEHDTSGEESLVWFRPKAIVFKSQLTTLYNNLQEKLDSITLHNAIFPNTALKVVGFGRNSEGDFQVLVEQTFITAKENDKVTDAQIEEYMTNLGFERTDGNNYSNGDVLIEDLHTGNAILTPEGNIAIIDPLMRMNTKEQGYGGNRVAENKFEEVKPKESKPTEKTEGGKKYRFQSQDWRAAQMSDEETKKEILEIAKYEVQNEKEMSQYIDDMIDLLGEEGAIQEVVILPDTDPRKVNLITEAGARMVQQSRIDMDKALESNDTEAYEKAKFRHEQGLKWIHSMATIRRKGGQINAYARKTYEKYPSVFLMEKQKEFDDSNLQMQQVIATYTDKDGKVVRVTVQDAIDQTRESIQNQISGIVDQNITDDKVEKLLKENEELKKRLAQKQSQRQAQSQKDNERVVKAKQNIKSAIEKFKNASKGGQTSVSLFGLNSEQIEAIGEIIKSYIELGYATTAKVVNATFSDLKDYFPSLTKDQVRSVGRQVQEFESMYGKEQHEKEVKAVKEGKIITAEMVRALVKMHFMGQLPYARTLAETLVAKLGLSEQEAKQMADSLESMIMAKVKVAVEAEMTRFAEKGNEPTLEELRKKRREGTITLEEEDELYRRIEQAKNQREVNKILKLVRLGKLSDNNDFARAFERKFGFRSIPTDIKKQLDSIVERIFTLEQDAQREVEKQLKDGTTKKYQINATHRNQISMLQKEYNTLLETQRKVTYAKVLKEVVSAQYVNMLSGTLTFVRAFMGGYISGALGTATYILSNVHKPKSLFKGLVAGIEAIPSAYIRAVESRKKGYDFFGESSLKGDYNADTMGWYERTLLSGLGEAYNNKEWLKVGYKSVGQLLKVIHALGALDTFMNTVSGAVVGTTEADKANQLYDKTLDADFKDIAQQEWEDLRNTIQKQVQTEVAEGKLPSSIDIDEEVTRRIKKELGITGSRLKAKKTYITNRVQELKENALGGFFEQGVNLAKDASLMGTPDGFVGLIVKSIKPGLDIKDDDDAATASLKFLLNELFKFVRITGQLANKTFNNIPVLGVANAFIGPGFNHNTGEFDKNIIKGKLRSNPLLVKQRIANNILVTSTVLALWLMMFDDDEEEGWVLDENRPIDVRGFGTGGQGGKYKNERTYEDFQNLSISFTKDENGKWTNYVSVKLIPEIAAIVATLASYSDYLKGDVDDRTKSYMKANPIKGTIFKALGDNAKILTESSFSSVGRIFKNIQQEENFFDGLGVAGRQLVIDNTKPLVNPTVFQSITKEITKGKPEKEAKGWEFFVKNLYGLDSYLNDNKTDVFGNEYKIESDYSKFMREMFGAGTKRSEENKKTVGLLYKFDKGANVSKKLFNEMLSTAPKGFVVSGRSIFGKYSDKYQSNDDKLAVEAQNIQEKYFREQVLENYEYLNSLETKEELEKALKELQTESVQYAKEEIVNKYEGTKKLTKVEE